MCLLIFKLNYLKCDLTYLVERVNLISSLVSNVLSQVSLYVWTSQQRLSPKLNSSSLYCGKIIFKNWGNGKDAIA